MPILTQTLAGVLWPIHRIAGKRTRLIQHCRSAQESRTVVHPQSVTRETRDRHPLTPATGRRIPNSCTIGQDLIQSNPCNSATQTVACTGSPICVPTWTPPASGCRRPSWVTQSNQCDSTTQRVACTADPACIPVWTPTPSTCSRPGTVLQRNQCNANTRAVACTANPVCSPVWTPSRSRCLRPGTVQQSNQCNSRTRDRSVYCRSGLYTGMDTAA